MPNAFPPTSLVVELGFRLGIVIDLVFFMKAIRNHLEVIARFFCPHFCLVSSVIVGFALHPIALADSLRDAEQCRPNLIGVFRAIQEYRAAHHRLPDQLRDLVPDYLPRANLLTCPACAHILEEESSRSKADIVADGTYVYEFELRPLTNGLAQGLDVTQRSWRQLQMGVIGSDVPMVRCTNHSPVLNLSFGGAIYESDPVWEGRFSGLVQAQDLSLDKLLAMHTRLDAVRIPARESSTPSELIDLTAHYNGSLNGWLEWNPAENLSGLPAGRTIIGGVAFDARGVIQLGSRNYAMLHRPAAVSNILVGLRCRSLVFLHGTVHGEAPGASICHYSVHLEDRSIEIVPIAYERDVLHWQISSGKRVPKNAIAVGRPRPRGGADSPPEPHLFTTRWTNPRPGHVVLRIDFVSLMTLSSPFLVSVSTEMEERRATSTGVNTNEN